MDIDPAIATAIGTALTGAGTGIGYFFRKRGDAAVKTAETAKVEADTGNAATQAVIEAARHTRGDLHDCRGEVEALKRQNAEQAAAITAIESSNVLLTHGFANLAQKHEGCERNVNGLRAEIDELRRSIT